MTIHVQCSCGQSFQLKPANAGRKFRCPQCQSVLTAEDGSETVRHRVSATSIGVDPDREGIRAAVLPRHQAASSSYAAWAADGEYSTSLPPVQVSTQKKSPPPEATTQVVLPDVQRRTSRMREDDRHPVLTVVLAILMGWHGLMGLKAGPTLIVSLMIRRFLTQEPQLAERYPESAEIAMNVLHSTIALSAILILLRITCAYGYYLLYVFRRPGLPFIAVSTVLLAVVDCLLAGGSVWSSLGGLLSCGIVIAMIFLLKPVTWSVYRTNLFDVRRFRA
ncbi:MAG: hypothetical protein KDA85_13950, partial [Planctomycetaceae bacterium]|nr:hypothetical protein [Planctomycetaceae bacterium]